MVYRSESSICVSKRTRLPPFHQRKSPPRILVTTTPAPQPIVRCFLLLLQPVYRRSTTVIHPRTLKTATSRLQSGVDNHQAFVVNPSVCTSANERMEEPTNSAEIDILERFLECNVVGQGDVEVEQTLRGHRNAADLLESGYSKDEVLHVLQESPLPLEIAVMTPVEVENPISQTPDMFLKHNKILRLMKELKNPNPPSKC
ncbi:hypothetical protein L2E82_38904 [Cichorium intybus]|uniref:Uncharacterized protein n=1 Tax=Cichorium intybus TaxID=13427 RepID=A0ACB9AGR0_CICIN|nr:hypothetical protein L2E82_38904 [Cichorium intybus]